MGGFAATDFFRFFVAKIVFYDCRNGYQGYKS